MEDTKPTEFVQKVNGENTDEKNENRGDLISKNITLTSPSPDVEKCDKLERENCIKDVENDKYEVDTESLATEVKETIIDKVDLPLPENIVSSSQAFETSKKRENEEIQPHEKLGTDTNKDVAGDSKDIKELNTFKSGNSVASAISISNAKQEEPMEISNQASCDSQPESHGTAAESANKCSDDNLTTKTDVKGIKDSSESADISLLDNSSTKGNFESGKDKELNDKPKFPDTKLSDLEGESKYDLVKEEQNDWYEKKTTPEKEPQLEESMVANKVRK